MIQNDEEPKGFLSRLKSFISEKARNTKIPFKRVQITIQTTDMTALCLTVLDQGYQVDISSAYFRHQIRGILENSTKAIEVKA